MATSLEIFKVFKIYRSAQERKLSGALRLSRDGFEKAIWFHEGAPFAAQSNFPNESLLNYLADEGILLPSQRSELEGLNKTENELVRLVVERGFCSSAVMRHAYQDLEQKRIVEALLWSSGVYGFTPREGLKPAHAPYDCQALCIEAASLMSAQMAAQFVAMFPNQKVILDSSANFATYDSFFPAPNAHHLFRDAFMPADFLRTVDEARANREISALVLSGLARLQANAVASNSAERRVPTTPLNEAAHSANRQIPNTVLKPAVTLESQTRPSPVSAPSRPVAAPNAPSNRVSPHDMLTPSAPPMAMPSESSRMTAKPAAAPATMQCKPITPQIQAKLDAARDLAEHAAEKTHYEVLGVEPTASIDEIRNAFRKFARDFHVDRFARFDISAEDRKMVQQAFIVANRANEVLTSADGRRDYDALLAAKADKSLKATSDTGFEQIVQAEKNVKEGLVLNRNSRFAPALERFQSALAVTPDDPLAKAGEAYAECMLACATSIDAAAVAKAVKTLQEVTTAYTNREEPFLYLGRVLRLENKLEDATKAFQTALKIAPHNLEVAAELRHVERKREEPVAKTKNKLFGLFGLGKK